MIFLPVQGAHQFIQDNGKSDGRCILAEFGEQVVVSTAPYYGVSGAVCIRTENHSGIIAVASAHSEIA